MQHIDLSKATTNKAYQELLYRQLHDLLTDNQGSLRYATSHMLDRRIFQIEQGFPVMTAAKNVEETLTRFDIVMQDELYMILIVEELIRLDKLFKLEWIRQHSAGIAAQRINHKCPELEWVIEDFVTGRYYSVPALPIKSQTQHQILDFCRKDAMTTKEFDLAAPRRPKAGKASEPAAASTATATTFVAL